MDYDVLTREAREGLLQYAVEITKPGTDLFKTTLELLKDLFHFNNVAYVVESYSPVTGQPVFTDITSYTMSKQMLEENRHAIAQNRNAFQVVRKELRNSSDRVIFSQDTNDPDYWESGYADFLGSYDFKYKGAFWIGSGASTVFMVYKTIEEGRFSESEKNVLRYVRRTLNNLVRAESEKADIINTLSSSDEYLDSQQTGRIIISRNSFYKHYNPYYDIIAGRYDASVSADVFTSRMITFVEKSAGRSIYDFSDPEVFRYQNYRIEVQPKVYPGFNHSKEQYTILTVRESDGAPMKIDASVIDRYQLSRREAEIARLLVEGKTYSQISEELFLSLSTVKTHVYNTFSKLDVTSKMEAIQKLTEK